MPEWSTYSLSDFLMFAPRTYYRLLELYNRELWPAQFAAIGGGLAAIVLAASKTALAGRLLHALLAVAWAWVAWGWLHERFATINWAATYVAAAFGLQALLLAAFALLGSGTAPLSPSRARSRASLALAAFAVLAYPAIALLAGRTIASAEVVGLAPDPTAIATLGVLAPASSTARAVLLAIPLASCGLSAAMLWTMASPAWWVPALAAAVAIAVAVGHRSVAGTRAGKG